MPCYRKNEFDLIRFEPDIQHGMPLAIDDMSLAFHLGIKNRTLWWVIRCNESLYRVFRIRKRGKNKGVRTIHNPDVRLKNIQRVFLGRFLSRIPFEEHVGAYVPDRGCAYTCAQHTKKSIIMSMDIKDFFPSVKRYMIRNVFKSYGYNHEVSSLMAQLVCYKNFVPQGAPTSGTVANMVAANTFDRDIIAGIASVDPGWVYTRYSDDIDISHNDFQDRDAQQMVVDTVKKSLSRHGFTMNEEKLRADTRGGRQVVLGAVVNDKVNVKIEEYRKIRGAIFACMMHGFDTQYKRSGFSSPDHLRTYLRGKVSYFKQLNPQKASRLSGWLKVAEELHAEESAQNQKLGVR